MNTHRKYLLGAVFVVLAMVGLTACIKPTNSDTPPVAGDVTALCAQKTQQGLCIINLGVAGATPVHFEAALADMHRLSDGSLQISNQLDLVMPEVRWTLSEASVTFKPAADGKGFDRIAGEARIPFDQLPILKKAKTGGGVMATLGYDLGENLDQLNAPLNPQTHYLFFAFKESFGVSFGFDDLGIPVRGGEAASKPFNFTPLPEAKLVMVLDAGDPFFYVSAKGLTPKKKKKPKDDEKKKKKSSMNIGGFGFSYHGRIPESVATPDFSKQMHGNLVLEGSIPFPPAPVINYNGFYLVGQDGLLQAISGDINLGFPLKWLLSFSISLGNASAIAEVKGDAAEILMAGRYQPDTSWVPAFIPLVPEEDVQMAVRLDTANSANNFVHGKGSYAIAGSSFAPQGLQFGKVFSKQGEFRITPGQVEMNGGVDSDLSPFRFGAGTHFSAVFAGQQQDNRLGIDGNILIGSLDSKGKLSITPAAVTLTANINAASDWQMALQGKLSNSVNQGLMLSGQFDVPSYLNDRIAGAVTQRVEQTTQDLQQQIADLTQQLKQLNADLPSVRAAAKKAAELALWNMDTNHEDAIINKEIAQQCKGVPFCSGAATKTYNDDKQVKAVKQQLNTLITVLNKKDDATTRAALKTALQRVIESNPVSVDLKLHKVKVAYLNKDRKAKLQAAISHIDQLKSKGGRQFAVKQQLDEFTSGTLNQLAGQIKQGAKPISVKSVGFEMPASGSTPIRLAIALAINGKPQAKPIAVSFDPKQPQQLPLDIIEQIK